MSAELHQRWRALAGGEAEALGEALIRAWVGAPRDTYCAYAAGIRAEYPRFADRAFAAGRGGFLEKQLTHRRTFRTNVYEREIGETARANMSWELEEMRGGRMVGT